MKKPHPLLSIYRQLNRSVDKVPKGWKTAAQWSKEMEVSTSHGFRILLELERRDKVQRERFNLLQPSGVVRAIPHYKKK